jgi:hypothetical protein
LKKGRLFDALKQGLDELAKEREGKFTLHKVMSKAPTQGDGARPVRSRAARQRGIAS